MNIQNIYFFYQKGKIWNGELRWIYILGLWPFPLSLLLLLVYTQTEGRIFRSRKKLHFFSFFILNFLTILWRLSKGLHFCPLTVFLLPLNIEDWECGNARPKPALTDHFSETDGYHARYCWSGWLSWPFWAGSGEEHGGERGEGAEGDGGGHRRQGQGWHRQGSWLWIPWQRTVGGSWAPAQGELPLFSIIQSCIWFTNFISTLFFCFLEKYIFLKNRFFDPLLPRLNYTAIMDDALKGLAVENIAAHFRKCTFFFIELPALYISWHPPFSF